jgi:hypothetical protein
MCTILVPFLSLLPALLSLHLSLNSQKRVLKSCADFVVVSGVSEISGGVGIVEMLFNSSLLALVGFDSDSTSFSPRHLWIYNSQSKQKICDFSFMTAILAVRMNRSR